MPTKFFLRLLSFVTVPFHPFFKFVWFSAREEARILKGGLILLACMLVIREFGTPQNYKVTMMAVRGVSGLVSKISNRDESDDMRDEKIAELEAQLDQLSREQDLVKDEVIEENRQRALVLEQSLAATQKKEEEKEKETIVEARVNLPACLIIREKRGDGVGDYKYKSKELACLPDKTRVRVFLDRGEIRSSVQNITGSGNYTFVYMEEIGGSNRSGWVAKEFLRF